jgi:sugar phosphate isomerase/epimerase
MTRLGVSTSILRDRTDLDQLLAYEPEVVEFYNYPSSMLSTVERFCARHGIQPALHTPFPYDEPVPLTRFAPTGPDPAEAAAALHLTELTVRCAADLGALHVVVHFPSPYPPYPKDGFTQWCADYLDAVESLAREHGVRVLVENLSPHPLLHTPAHYRDALEARPDLGFCLDLGHAHLLSPHMGPLRFAEVLGRRVRSMHVYNTSADRYPRHGHEAASPEQDPSRGFLGLAEQLPRLLGHTLPAALILEHGPTADVPAATLTWLRDLIPSEASI